MSGFKISTESLRPEFYQVVLTLSGGTGTYPTADGTDNGAVYPQDHSQFTTKPTTLVIGQRVARGHLRFMNIVDAVSRFADAQIQDVQFASGGVTVAANQPTSVTFTIRYDRSGAASASNILTSVTNSSTAVSSTGGKGLGVASFAPTTGGAITIDTTAKALALSNRKSNGLLAYDQTCSCAMMVRSGSKKLMSLLQCTRSRNYWSYICTMILQSH
jgi:hypothetical protein